MTLTQLISYLLDKLLDYKFDQLMFKNLGSNTEINITKYGTDNKIYYHFYNLSIPKINNDDFYFYSF